MSKYPLVDKTNAVTSLSEREIARLTQLVTSEYNTYLKQFQVKLPRENSAKFLWLIFLRKHMGEQVHKDTISSFVTSVLPGLGKDQQVRHLAADGFYVLNFGEKLPNLKRKVERGYHVLISMEQVKPNFMHKVLKRLGRVAATDFESLKAVYDFKCATCGAQEGRPHRYFPNTTVELHRGHKNPNEKFVIENIIPQCQLCNKYYSDKYYFDDNGRIVKVNKR